MAKGRESGMPDEATWESFFRAECVMEKLAGAGGYPIEGDVVEFGCGYGLFTTAAARLTQGRVHALDIDSEMIRATTAAAARAGAENVVVEQRDFLLDGCGLADGAASYAMLFNILHISEADELLREAYRVLAPGGRLAIMHWIHSAKTPRGPSLAIRPTAEQCQARAERAGFELVRHEPLACCPWHWGLVMARPLSASSQARRWDTSG